MGRSAEADLVSSDYDEDRNSNDGKRINTTLKNGCNKSKAITVINQSRGYESENDKSIDSSTTSSTLILQLNMKMRKNTVSFLSSDMTPK